MLARLYASHYRPLFAVKSEFLALPPPTSAISHQNVNGAVFTEKDLRKRAGWSFKVKSRFFEYAWRTIKSIRTITMTVPWRVGGRGYLFKANERLYIGRQRYIRRRGGEKIRPALPIVQRVCVHFHILWTTFYWIMASIAKLSTTVILLLSLVFFLSYSSLAQSTTTLRSNLPLCKFIFVYIFSCLKLSNIVAL